MMQGRQLVGLNSPEKTLVSSIVLEGRKADPTAGIPFLKKVQFSIEPTRIPGITFRVGEVVIPYDAQHLHAVDTKLGRMLALRHPEHDIQIMLVEHLLSALTLLGLTDIQIVLDHHTRGPLTSGSIPKFGMKRPTYWVPVMGSGVEGYIKAIFPHCQETGKQPDIIQITQELTHTIIDENPKYNGLKRTLTIKPSDKFRIRILSALQPDIQNCPTPDPMLISEGDYIGDFLCARPIMRIRNIGEQLFVFLLNLLGSSILTHDTYTKSRPGLTPDEIVARMFPQFRKGKYEFLYHAALADRLGEIAAFLNGKHIHGEFIMENMNHVAHMEALRRLMSRILGK